MKFTTNLISLDFVADTVTFHLPPGTRMGAGTYCIEWLTAGQPQNCRPTEKAQEHSETAGAAGAAGEAAFREFAQKSMPWILGEPLDDTDRLVRGTAAIAFQAGRAARSRQEPEAAGAGRQEPATTAEAAEPAEAAAWKAGNEFLPYHPSASHVPPDYRDGWNHCYAVARSCGAWQPQFDAISHKQETLVLEFCAEIAGPKGQPGRPPDPVRLLEMAQALYEAEREAMAP